MSLTSTDFKSVAYASSATEAKLMQKTKNFDGSTGWTRTSDPNFIRVML